MAMEAALPSHGLFRSPSTHHLAELRIEPAHSAIAFSAPFPAGGRKRRCLLPAASTRKKMLLELDPFGSSPPPSLSPPPSPLRSPATAPPLLSRVGSPASEFSFRPTTIAWTGGDGRGGGGGNIFAFAQDATTTPSARESNSSAISILASPGPPVTPTGSSASSVFAFANSPKQPTTPKGPNAGWRFAFATSPKQPTTPKATGPTASGGFVFTASAKQPPTPTGSTASGGFVFTASAEQPPTPTGSTARGGFVFTALGEQPLTPTGSTATGGVAPLSSSPSLSPREYQGSRVVIAPSLPSPKPKGSNDSGGFDFFPSPGPPIAHMVGSPASPGFVFLSPRAPPVRKSSGSTGRNKMPRRNLSIATAPRRSLRQLEEPKRVSSPPHKVDMTGALSTGEASRSAILSGSSFRPCCTFITSPAKARNQEAKKASSEAHSSSPAGSRCRSPARPSSMEKATKQEREVEVSSVAREGPSPTSPAACRGAEVVVRVTCTCGVHKEFCFDHCH